MFLPILAMVIAVVSGFLGLIRQYQMLQQNSYFASRYFRWLKGNTPILPLALKGFVVILAFLAAMLGENTFKESITLFAAVALYFGWRAASQNGSSIKKLVYTARVKRMFAFSFVLTLMLGVLGLVIGGIIGTVLLTVLVVLSIFPEILCLLSLFALKPVEISYANYYINDAKKLLSSVYGIKVVGITGSFGKTSTKYILSRILSEKFNVLHTPESFNTPMGVVRTIRESLKADTEIFVCEMGAKNVGDIKEICDIVHPDFGLITSVGAQHLETFKTTDNVFKTKFELYDAVKAKGGVVFANGDNKIIVDNANDDVILYSSDAGTKFYAENITSGRNGANFDLVLNGEKVAVSTKLLGRHNILNIIGAAALAYELGVMPEDIAFAISRLTPTEHRLELKTSVKGSLLIDDAYNANPEGCLEAVNVLNSFDGMQKVIITPGLVELGDKEFECNKALGSAAAKVCDKIIFVGKKRSEPLVEGAKEAGFNTDNMYIASSFMEAMEIYTAFCNENTVVLLENDLPDNYLK
ncbi:MAG: UDP-N-acetylmuramoyl-tripeptide--D-alanyl-D-alanine ligase [Clostridia bacterium]|nr:UDP-N-acetylmuramoyl-tripeptide--D-alanyl-D-alanine ligase [Clostridia bacterium]